MTSYAELHGQGEFGPMPDIPQELCPPVLPIDWQWDIEELWTAISDELTDQDYETLTHGKLRCYDRGCRGPVCRKFARDMSKSRARSAKPYQPRRERMYDPVIEYFFIIVKQRRETMLSEV